MVRSEDCALFFTFQIGTVVLVCTDYFASEGYFEHEYFPFSHSNAEEFSRGRAKPEERREQAPTLMLSMLSPSI
jgi:hypothetical protein